MDRGPLAPDEVIALARQVGDALEHAHRHGVIHRDVKPENILLSDGHAIVADFGIAKAVTAASDKAITRTGFPVGTVGYMSPEQAAGFSELNERADVFSLTCVIYEMLIGQVPGMWPSEESGRVLRLMEAPAEHSVSVSPAGGRTRILIDESLTPTAGAVFGGLMGGVGGGAGFMGFGLGMGALHSALAAFAFLASAVGGSFVAARSVFRSTGAKRHRELEQLADRLASHIAETNTRTGRGRLPR